MLKNIFSKRNKATTSKTARDPICGMTVDIATALKSEHDGETYYFCSLSCQQAFESQTTA
jgi:YHS domain-containing protein